MRVIFFGTPEFAVPSLRAMLERHDVILVVSQPDRPAGRGMALRRSPVAELAVEHGVRLLLPLKARDPELEEAARTADADVCVVAAYGQILPIGVLDAPRLGAYNVHASLLPRWRGASPVAAAVRAGDAVTGVSIMRMDVGLDTGPVLLRREVAILPRETTGDLTTRLAGLGADAILEALERLAAGPVELRPQQADGVTYAGLVRKSDGDLDWSRGAVEIDRAVRAFDPWPGARLPLGPERVRVLEGRPLPAWTGPPAAAAAPGDILEVGREGVLVMASDTPFLVTRVQPPGKRPMAAAEYARGRRDLVTSGG